LDASGIQEWELGQLVSSGSVWADLRREAALALANISDWLPPCRPSLITSPAASRRRSAYSPGPPPGRDTPHNGSRWGYGRWSCDTWRRPRAPLPGRRSLLYEWYESEPAARPYPQTQRDDQDPVRGERPAVARDMETAHDQGQDSQRDPRKCTGDDEQLGKPLIFTVGRGGGRDTI